MASKIDTCRMARARDACGGVVRSARMAFKAAVFQLVTTSAAAVLVTVTSAAIVAIISAECLFRRFPGRRGCELTSNQRLRISQRRGHSAADARGTAISAALLRRELDIG